MRELGAKKRDIENSAHWLLLVNSCLPSLDLRLLCYESADQCRLARDVAGLKSSATVNYLLVRHVKGQAGAQNALVLAMCSQKAKNGAMLPL